MASTSTFPDQPHGPEPTSVYSPRQRGRTGISDLVVGLSHADLWGHFAVHDIRLRFRRSVLGPFWLTISMGITVGVLGFIFGQLWNRPLDSFVPYLAAGFIFWGFLTSTIVEGCDAFSGAGGFIRNVPMPLSVHFYRVVARNLLVWAHNMVILVLVAAIFPPRLSPVLLLFVPGFALFLVNISWLALVCAVISTRYRDVPPIIASLVQVAFFFTPIIWRADQLSGRAFFIDLNPAYHLLQLVRAPLLGETPALESWLVCAGLAVVGSLFAVALFARAHRRLPFWV